MMTTDFSQPQRQSAIGIIIMAANTAQRVVRALIAPLIIALVKADKGYLLYFAGSLLVVLLVILIFSYFSYRRFTFYLDRERQEFVVNKGIFNRTQLTIQLDKIQQVAINQNLLQKVVGIYGLKIDTAGSEGKEVSIKAIDQQIANRLREHLLDRTRLNLHESDELIQSEPQVEIPFLHISPSTLFKVGLTSNYGSSIALVLAFLFPTFQHAREISNALAVDKGQVEQLLESTFTLFSIAVLVALLLAALLIINVVRTFVRYFDFQVSKHKHSLLISAGLFARKNTLLSPNKVQITTYSQNYFQKKMNLINVGLKQTESGQKQNGEEARHGNLEVPGCSAAERDQILTMILGKVPAEGAVFKPNFRFLNLPIFCRTVLPFGVYLIFLRFYPLLSAYLPLAICYVLVSVLMIYLSYKRHRIIVNQEMIIKKKGIWDIEHEIIFPHKIQAITTFQYPWHKSVDVGHVNLHTAGGMIQFKYGNYTEIKQLVNYWLYQIESSSEEWM